MQFGVELDDKLEDLKSTTEVTLDNLQDILITHKFLVDKITEITKLENILYHQNIYISICQIIFYLW